MVIYSHFIYNYLRDTYTTKRVRYLGQFQNEKYSEIINELKKKQEIQENNNKNNDENNDINKNENHDEGIEDDMQQILIDFVKEYKA